MRASSITLLLATGLTAVMGCGSGGGAGPSGEAGPLENGSYQRPPSSYQAPPATGLPSDYDKPPSTYEKPGSGTGTNPPSGQKDTTCELLCGMAVDQNCAADPDSEGEIQALPLDQCIAACEAELSDIDCEAEFRRATSCIAEEVELNCKQLGQIQGGQNPDIPLNALQTCGTAIQPLASCREGDPNPDDGDGSCTVTNRCQGCADDCQSCRCENLGDDGPCTDCRPNP